MLDWDGVPRWLRHAALMLLAALLTWAVEDGLPTIGPWLSEHQPLGPLAGVAAGQALAWLLPIVRYRAVSAAVDGRHES